MNPDKSNKIWILKAVVMMLILVLASWIWMKELHIKEMEQEIVSKEARFAMMQLQNQLQVPSEVLYFDYHNLGRELAELRMKSFENYGVSTYLPYKNVSSPNGEIRFNSSREVPAVVHEDYHLGQLQDSSPEHYWTGKLQVSCRNLASQINMNDDLGGFLKQHPEQFDKHVRPFIIRLLDAYNPHVSYEACDVLLAIGDRSDELMEILSILPRKGPLYKIEVLAKRYNLSFKSYESAPLSDGPINKWYPEWKRVHQLTTKLKTKYPVIMRTNISNWRLED